jgi:hypothetical protein
MWPQILEVWVHWQVPFTRPSSNYTSLCRHRLEGLLWGDMVTEPRLSWTQAPLLEDALRLFPGSSPSTPQRRRNLTSFDWTGDR